MSDLICRKTMRRCETPGMCSPFGGCSDPVQDGLKDELVVLRDQVTTLISKNDLLIQERHSIIETHRQHEANLEQKLMQANQEIKDLRAVEEMRDQEIAWLQEKHGNAAIRADEAEKDAQLWKNHKESYLQTSGIDASSAIRATEARMVIKDSK